MKFLLISRFIEGANILYRIKEEGNEVALCVVPPEDHNPKEEEPYHDAWEGLLPRVCYRDYVDRDTIVLFDTTGLGDIAEELKRAKIPVFGASKFADDLEKDRKFGTEVMKKSGIKIPETIEFGVANLKGAIKFVKDNMKSRHVFKPSGDAPTRLTYAPPSNEMLYHYLEYLDENDVLKECKVTEFVLQEFIEGIAVSTEGWSNGRKFVPTFNHTIENKKFQNDNLGGSTGCEGNIVWAESHNCAVVRRGIARLDPNGHVGGMDLNEIVNEQGEWALEWTPRWGYEATPTLLALYPHELGKLFSDFARGQAKDIELNEGFAGAVRFSIPPYPLEPQHSEVIEHTSGLPIMGLKDSDLDHIHFYEVRLNKRGDIVHSEGLGLLGCVYDVADDCESCFDVPYEILDRMKVPDLQYRTDLADVLSKDYDKFMSLGG